MLISETNTMLLSQPVAYASAVKGNQKAVDQPWKDRRKCGRPNSAKIFMLGTSAEGARIEPSVQAN